MNDEVTSILDGVDELIERTLGLTGIPRYGKRPIKSKTAAIDLSQNGIPGNGKTLDGSNLVKSIFDRIKLNHESMGSLSPSPSNWQCRKAVEISDNNASPEKRLEKTIVNWLDDSWFNQIPTCNGMAVSKEYHRCIDLGHSVAEKQFELIELKFGKEARNFGSDNPLFALLELVEYAALYLYSRSLWTTKDTSERRKLFKDDRLMKAERIEWFVAAPAGYFRYKNQNELQQLDLGWLAIALGTGLSSVSCEQKGPKMSLQLKSISAGFEQRFNALQDAECNFFDFISGQNPPNQIFE